MATDNAIRSVTRTLTTTVADTITINQLYPGLEVTNFDTTNTLYVLMDGTTTPTAAVADAKGVTAIPPGTAKVVRTQPVAGGTTVVLSVVGSGGKYSIEGVV